MSAVYEGEVSDRGVCMCRLYSRMSRYEAPRFLVESGVRRKKQSSAQNAWRGEFLKIAAAQAYFPASPQLCFDSISSSSYRFAEIVWFSILQGPGHTLQSSTEIIVLFQHSGARIHLCGILYCDK